MKIRIDGKVSDIRAVWSEEGTVRMLDQRILPHRVEVLGFRDHHRVAEAIKDMTVRGAPAIGVAAAYGMMLAANNGEDLEKAAKELKGTRPTAFDLFFAVDHMLSRIREGEDPADSAEEYAETIVERCRLIGSMGEAHQGRRPHNDALQRRSPGHRGLGYGLGADKGGLAQREGDLCLCVRDQA